MRLLFSLLAVCLAFSATPAFGSVIFDGDFTSFSFNSTGTATVVREASGGNPGARLNITTISGDLVYGTALKTDVVSFSALEGTSFQLSLDVLSGPGGFGQGQGIHLLVEQGGAIYGKRLGITGWPFNTWDTISFNDTFEASTFELLIGSGPANPNLDGGVATRFGFAGRNSRSGTLTQYYDNFRLEGPSLLGSSVPEPPSIAILGFGAIFLVGMTHLFASRRRKAVINL